MNPTQLLADDYILKDNVPGIHKIAAGKSLYDPGEAAADDYGLDDAENDEDADIVKLRNKCLAFVVALKHHGQTTEAGVKDIGTCTDTRRNEIQASSLSSFRSLVNMFVSNMVAKAMK